MIHGGDIYRNHIELDFSVNINPLGIPQNVKRALVDAIEQCTCYPDPVNEELMKGLATYYDKPEAYFLLGNGASELIQAVIQAVHPKKVLLLAPSFSGYERACKSIEQCEISYHYLHERDGFVCKNDILDAITSDIDMVFLTNPNNPVGNCMQMDLLENIIEKAYRQNIIVLLDECFIDFLINCEEHTFIPKIERYTNVVLLKAFTKIYAIPGIRLGYAICSDVSLNQRISKNLPEWNISVLAQKAGTVALLEKEYIRETQELVQEERNYLMEELQRLHLKVFASEANFILFYSEVKLYHALLLENILIRDCSNYIGLKEGYYRVAIKDHKSNVRLIQKMCEIITGV